MTKLLQTANFYLCTSSTEGLNLPMIQAMSNGVVPISTRATAMADYINEKNAIVIENDNILTDGSYHFLNNYLPTTHFPPRFSSIVDALISAADIPENRYKSLSNQARKDVHEKYSLQAFVDKIKKMGRL